ncbi:hypothetical protein A9Q96_13555 [Rhodobacterales bacterium 52_120_T64]|nr:hypothetical protein A9Q96_13555 [Rhodobacterales bacterium 52_120_T64]
MTTQHRTSIAYANRNVRFDMGWVLSIVLSIAVILAQSIPVMADQGSNVSATWVEICADGGSYFIEIGEDGQKQTPECTHCDFCLTSIGEMPFLYSTDHDELALIDFSLVSYSSNQAALPDCPEQYWSACRGPPIVSVENKMISNTSLTIKESIGPDSIAWSIPCA